MTIKSDRWIREMALQHGMIEPFQAEQVRGGVISYGLSSYGYDMRVADEWKVFTNVFNTLVDPKHFDPRSFVDLKGDYCDIPPNSFVLARSVEYFRIPRRVLSVVLGKSTYARCFSADTRVALVDGTSRSIEQLTADWQQDKSHYGYSISQNGQVITTLLEHPRYIDRDSLLEITLDNGRSIRCTPDHNFMLRDGTMAAAATLREGTSLMPLYMDLIRGQEMVYQPLTGHYSPILRLADVWKLGHRIYEDAPSASPRRPGYNTNTGTVAFRNHKVTSVKELPGTHDVYCLTVPEAGNFALDAGVFVQNCGLIVNVTPLEPAWQGYVTIEISNTTPLPARVYANEGVAQVLFLESDEDCMTSYADKAGKYQNQVGVVPPKM